jgi:hypothetical protein
MSGSFLAMSLRTSESIASGAISQSTVIAWGMKRCCLMMIVVFNLKGSP